MTISKDKIKNILVIRRNNIGDMICTIPLLRTLRKELPDAHIAVLAEETNAGILEKASFIDAIIIYKKGHGLYGNKYLGYYKLLKKIKNDFDLAIGVKIGFSSLLAFITLISGAKIRVGCTPDRWHPLQLCYNFPIKKCSRWKSLNQVDAVLELLKAVGINNHLKDISIEVVPESEEGVKKFFRDSKINLNDNIAVLNISNNRPENKWPLERFKELSEKLYLEYRALSIITSTISDIDKSIKLTEQITGRAFYYKTSKVMDFAALVSKANLLICGEGGAMHIGAGVHTSTISLWANTRPEIWAPYGEKQYVIKKGAHVDSISVNTILEIIRENKLLSKKEFK